LTALECLTYKRTTAAELSHLRSLLFAPGSDERKLRRALASGAHAVIADLEHAVAPAEKDSARLLTAGVLREAETDCARMVRINAVGTDDWEEDLQAVADLELDAVVLPKATPAAVEALGSEGPPVVAIVETALGLRLAFETASGPRVAALVLGAVDLAVEVGLEPREDAQEILYARSKVAIDSAAAGLRGPFDVVHLDVHDARGLEEQCRLARSLGFRGKACIHPGQIETVNRLFAPSERELEWARGVVEAFEGQSEGVLALDGAMVDLPVVERARRVLQEAERSMRE
jgi:citrate lyase subunit beta/citryl-CoA lyase